MRDSPRAWRSLLLRLLSFNLSARRVASLVTSSCHVIPSSLFGEQTCTRIPHMRRTHPRTCPDAGRFPPSMGSSLILQQLQGRTYVSQTRWQLQTDCVTALSNCLSREKRHSSTLLACFVFVDVTVTISPSIVTGESGENCAVMMIGDIDSVFGSTATWYATKFRWLLPASILFLWLCLSRFFTKLLLEGEKWHDR